MEAIRKFMAGLPEAGLGTCKESLGTQTAINEQLVPKKPRLQCKRHSLEGTVATTAHTISFPMAPNI